LNFNDLIKGFEIYGLIGSHERQLETRGLHGFLAGERIKNEWLVKIFQ